MLTVEKDQMSKRRKVEAREDGLYASKLLNPPPQGVDKVDWGIMLAVCERVGAALPRPHLFTFQAMLALEASLSCTLEWPDPASKFHRKSSIRIKECYF